MTTPMTGADFDTSFGSSSRQAPFTISTLVKLTGASPNGCIFAAGDNPAIKLNFDAGSLCFAAGNTTSDKGAFSVVSGFANSIGRVLRIVAHTNSGGRIAYLKVDGEQIGVDRNDDGSSSFNLWASIAGVSVGYAAPTPSTTLASAVETAPADFEILGPVSLFTRQLLRQ